jgi:hypothetical protein
MTPSVIQSISHFNLLNLIWAYIGYFCMYSLAIIDGTSLAILIFSESKIGNRIRGAVSTLRSFLIKGVKFSYWRKIVDSAKFPKLAFALANFFLVILWAISNHAGDHYGRLAHDLEEQNSQQQIAQAQWDAFRRELPNVAIKAEIPKLLKCREQRFQVLAAKDVSESTDLADTIADTLEKAGWIKDKTVDSIPGDANYFPNLGDSPGEIELPGESTAWITICTNTRGSAATARGIEAICNLVKPRPIPRYFNDSVPLETILIIVNPKPTELGPWDEKRGFSDLIMGPINPVLPIDKKFLNFLQSFPQQPFTIYCPKHDLDADFFVYCVSAVFGWYGWNQMGIIHENYPLEFGKIRVEIGADDKANNGLGIIADDLLNNFKRIGIANADEIVHTVDDAANPKGSIAIRIGLVPPTGGMSPFTPLP